MTLQPYLIAEYKKGLQKNKKPFLIFDSAFQELYNAYIWRDSATKRNGIKLIGRLRRVLEAESLGNTTAVDTINIPDIFGASYLNLRATEANAEIEPGSLVITIGAPDTATFTDQGDGTFAVTGLGDATGSYVNYVTGEVNLVFTGTLTGGGAISADINYFPSFSAMGITTRELAAINVEDTVFFDQKYAYSWNGDNFIEFASTTPTTWDGTDSDFFWTTNYRGSDPSSRLFFASNFVADANNPMRYYETSDWNTFQPVITGTNAVGESVGTVTTPWTAFAGNLTNTPIIPGTVSITLDNGTDPAVIFTDELRDGTLTGHASTNSGTIDYTTGAIALTLSPALTMDTTVVAKYQYNNQYLFQAQILIPYYGRLVAINTYEGTSVGSSTNFFNRARFSQVGNPIETDAWVSTTFGKGGFVDAPTNEAAVSARFYKNTLIVQFERSTWELRYLGEYGLPFIWERISSDFGSESTFSTVLFDKGVLAIGDKAIVASSGNNVERIDLDIPDTVFNFNNTNNGKKRVQVARDFRKEIVYWSYSDGSLARTYPNRVLLYNYRNDTWAIFRDNVTCFGPLETQAGISWDSETSWDDPVSWDQIYQSEFPVVASGNQQGFIHFYQYPADLEALADTETDMIETESLSITAVTRSATAALQIEVKNHNIENGEIIYITGMMFLDTATSAPLTTDINDNFYSVQWEDADTLSLYKWDFDSQSYIATSGDNISFTPATGTGTYIGGGRVTLIPKMEIKTKDFNPYQGEGKQVVLSYADMQADASTYSAVSIQVLENQQVITNSNVELTNQILSTAPTQWARIEEATQANPCVIKSTNHGLKSNQQALITLATGMTNLNGNIYTVTFIDLDHFSLDVDSSLFPAYTGGGKWVAQNNIQPYQTGSSYNWYRFYSSAFGQYLTFLVTYDDNLMNQKQTHQQNFQMNAFQFWARPGGRLV